MINKPKLLHKALNSNPSKEKAGAIHLSEIAPTVLRLGQELNMNLSDNLLGSAGKKTFSGDIDLAILIEDKDIFVEKLTDCPSVIDVQRPGVISALTKIQNYDPNIPCDYYRSGYVQIDFMIGDVNWLKTYYHSPSDTESKYKGAFRNIMIAAICLEHERIASKEKLQDGRAIREERWMFSPRDGLVRVERTPIPKSIGQGYTKKNKNQIIEGPYRNLDAIAKKLKLDSPKDLNSYESLKSAVVKNYRQDQVQKIFDNFVNDTSVIKMGIPEDLK